MKYILAIIASLLVLSGSAAAEVKVAYVDLQRALLETKEGQQAKDKLEKMKAKRQTQLDARQEELRTLQKNLEAQQAFMKEDVRRQKEMEFAEQLKQLQFTYASLQKELAQEEANLTQDIIIRMGRILANVGSQQGFTLILEKTESRILWAPRHLDLTNDLIRRFNAGEGQKQSKAKQDKKKAGPDK